MGIPLVLAFVEALARQRLLFASLASSAFLIYLDPEHEMSRVRTLVLSQVGVAGIGRLCHAALGPGYLAAGLSMLVVIGAMVTLDLMSPPAVSTARRRWSGQEAGCIAAPGCRTSF